MVEDWFVENVLNLFFIYKQRSKLLVSIPLHINYIQAIFFLPVS